jgi:hypothetical protein
MPENVVHDTQHIEDDDDGGDDDDDDNDDNTSDANRRTVAVEVTALQHSHKR